MGYSSNKQKTRVYQQIKISTTDPLTMNYIPIFH